jgi:hypothetical protein
MSICFWSVDLNRFAQHHKVNYLHSGDTLDGWMLRHDLATAANQLHARANPRGSSPKTASSRRNSTLRLSLKEQVWADPDRLAQELSESVDWRRQFHQLGCRGFSYRVDAGMPKYAGSLSSRIDFRLALMPSHELFYPSAISRYFSSRGWHDNHYYQGGMPSIAFCFGRTIGRTWYILIMQSDLSSSAPAAVRDHFRGWRNILFANVVAQAKGNADRIRLCLTNDVVRGCLRGSRENTGSSARWSSIYDGTAQDWQMRVVRARTPINIQLYTGQRSVYAHQFHQLSLRGSRSNSALGSENARP